MAPSKSNYFSGYDSQIVHCPAVNFCNSKLLKKKLREGVKNTHKGGGGIILVT